MAKSVQAGKARAAKPPTQRRGTPPAKAAFVPMRGRPTATQLHAIERTILAAASQDFLANGFDGATMDGIAAKAGVSKPTLYKRYPDKASLLRAVMDERLTDFSALTSRPDWVVGDTLEQRLRNFSRTMLRWVRSNEASAFKVLISATMGGAPDVARTTQEVGRLWLLNRMEYEIREYSLRDGMPAKHPRATAETLAMLLLGFMVWKQFDRITDRDIDTFANDAVELIMRGRAAF
jgi:AcrR family transcriptional regulator